MFALRHQFFVERFDHRIALGCTEGGHVEHGSYWSASALYSSFTPFFPTVSINGGNTHELTDFSVAERAQFWQVWE